MQAFSFWYSRMRPSSSPCATPGRCLATSTLPPLPSSSARLSRCVPACSSSSFSCQATSLSWEGSCGRILPCNRWTLSNWPCLLSSTWSRITCFTSPCRTLVLPHFRFVVGSNFDCLWVFWVMVVHFWTILFWFVNYGLLLIIAW